MNILEQSEKLLPELTPNVLIIHVGVSSLGVLGALVQDKARYASVSKYIKTVSFQQCESVCFSSKVDNHFYFSDGSDPWEYINKVFKQYSSDITMAIIITTFNTPFGAKIGPLLAKYFSEKIELTIGIAHVFDTQYIPDLNMGIEEFEKYTNSFIQITDSSVSNFIKLSADHIPIFGEAQGAMAEAVYCYVEPLVCNGIFCFDFPDLHIMMEDSKMGFLGYGIAEGDNRSEVAITQALKNLPITPERLGQVEKVLFLMRCNVNIMIEEFSMVKDIISKAVSDDAKILFQILLNREDDALSVTILAFTDRLE